jgi:CRP-like cAMP-binding protein
LEEIQHYFELHFGISSPDWDLFSSKLIQYSFPKKAILLSQGETENHLSFVSKGIVRQYVPMESSELTFGFAFSGSFISAYDSFISRTPSKYVVETISETVLWRLTYDDLQMIYKTSQIGDRIGRMASEDLFLKKSKRELSLLMDSPEERYLKLFTERPEVIREIPLKYVASYIGVTPQALSRIRKRIS